MNEETKEYYELFAERGLCYTCGKDKKRVVEFEVEVDDERTVDVVICRKCYRKSVID